MTLDQHLAEAIALAFWETAERPRKWSEHSWQEQQVWVACAQRAIAAGKQYRQMQADQKDEPR